MCIRDRPLCDTSKAYFETFNNGLESKGCNLCLRWSIQPKTDIIRHEKLIEFSYSPEDASLKDHFPGVLLSWCTSLYEKFVSRVYNHPRLKQSFLAGVDRYRGAKYIGFNVEERMQLAEALKCRISDKHASQTVTFEEQCSILSKENHKIYVLNASRNSPLKRRAHEECNAEIANMHAALAEAKRELGDTRKELGSTREEAKRNQEVSERRVEMLQAEVAHLSEKNSYLNENMAAAVSDLLSSRAERTALSEENDSLREELKSTKANQQLVEETSMHQSRLHQESFRRIKLSYASSLRRPHREQNEWIIDDLKKTIEDMGTDFEYLVEVTQGSSLHQIYKELNDECKKLLVLTPPESPTSADHVKRLL